MIRFAVISLSTLAVLGLIFYFVVWHAQPPAVASGNGPEPVVPVHAPSTQESNNMVGPGYKPWIVNLENGVVVSKFTAIEYTPQKDKSFLVDHPVWVFYLDHGQCIKVTGDSGIVNTDTSGPAPANGIFSGPTSSPKNGSLYHVRVELLPSESATKPTEWMETNNIHFDNDSQRMYTETFVDAQGNTIPADQVPVTVRGDEYEFDGNGMTLVWNAEKKLEKLEIARGKRLEIINPSKLSLPGMTADDFPRDTKVDSLIAGGGSPGSEPKSRRQTGASAPGYQGQLFSSDIFSQARRPISRKNRSGVLVADVHSQSPSPTASVLPYQAVFNDQVKIDDAARTVATADLMTVDFLQKAGGTNTPAAVVPIPSPAIVQPTETVPQPPANPPSTKPTNGPVTIYWTGKLLVTPLRGQPMMPISSGQSVVRLTGSPVKLTPQGSEVTAASATYRNPDGAVQLTHSASVPYVNLTQDKGLALSTGSIDYDPATSIAKLTGPSALAVPVNQKQMTVNWSQQGLLHVVRLPGQPNGVDHVDLTGDVVVDHPLFGLKSRELQLDLDLRPKKGGTSTETDEQLRLLTAIDNVTCQLKHPDKPTEEIDGDRLVVRTEPTANKQGVLPREVVADGHVHAFDPDQSITAGHLDALLIAKAGPATQTSPEDVGNAVDLESLYASTDVHAKMKNDATAVADQLRVTTVDGKQKVDLWGPNGAKLDNGKGSWLTGPIVHLVPDRNGVSVEGPGSMEAIRVASTTQPAGTEPPRPIDISWTDSMSLDGSANIADVMGTVTVKNTDAVGTISTITGDKAHLDLVDIPKNSTQPSTTPLDAMAGKQLKLLTLSGHVVGSSELKNPDGTLVRQEDLFGDKLIYNAIEATAIIPGTGKLYVENHKADANAATSQGAMAIQWSKQLTYNQNTQKITIDGDTRVGFEQDKKSGKPVVPMQLDSQQLIIALNKTNPAGNGKMQLSEMQSIGQVHFVANGIELYCDEADYDPKSGIMTLTGNPGRAVNAAGTASGSFDLLHFDTVKQEVIDGKNIKGKIER